MSDHSITSLIEKLEGAEGPSLVLDGEIWCAVNGYTFVMWDGAGCVYRRKSDGGISHEQASHIRPFSASLDAARALAERLYPEPAKSITGNDRSGYVAFLMWKDGRRHGSRQAFPDPALALCAAVLRAQSEARV